MMMLAKKRNSVDFSGEVAVQRPSPLPLLLGYINQSQSFECHG